MHATRARRPAGSASRGLSCRRVDLSGHRRRRLPRLAPVRRAARARPPRDLRRQPRDRLARQHRAHPRPRALPAPRRRHHRALLRRRAGRLRLPPRLAGLADRLPAPAAAHAQGRLLRHPPHARPGQGQARALPDRLHQRGLRRPAGAPAVGELLGPRQPDRPARRLRRGQALRRGADDGLPPPAGRRHGDRADLQHLRLAHAPARRPRDPDVPAPGAREPADHGVRRRQPDALVLLRQRPDPRHHRAGRVRLPRPGQHRQPRRVHAARARRDGPGADGLELGDRLSRRCRSTTPSSAGRTSRSRASCSAGRPRCRCATGCSARSSSPASSC